MKKNIYWAVTLATWAALGGGMALAASESETSKAAPTGSIRPAGKIAKEDLPGLAKISFADALKDATTATPGSVIAGELEVEDGNLQYSFDIVGAHKKVTEVEIDAGNGKVLATDSDDEDDEDDAAKPNATPAAAPTVKKG